MRKKILTGVFVMLLPLLLILPGFFIKVQIVCKSQLGGCPAEIDENLRKLDGKSIFVAKRQIKKELKSYFLMSEYSTQFKLPNILRVNLIVKKPIFAIRNISTNTYGLVNKDGIVLAQSNTNSLPVVFVKEATPMVGQTVSSSDLFALNLIDGVFKMYQIGSGFVEERTLLVELPGGVRVIFPLEGADRDLLLGSLRLIYPNVQNDSGGSNYSQIDLRYKNPILR